MKVKIQLIESTSPQAWPGCITGWYYGPPTSDGSLTLLAYGPFETRTHALNDLFLLKPQDQIVLLPDMAPASCSLNQEGR
jgi:hypothetical protein